MNIVEQNKANIIALCQTHKVDRLYVFGSVLTDHFSSTSDVDFVVKFGEIDLYDYATNYFELKELLEKTLHRDVDLLEEQALKNPYLKNSIEQTKRLVYEYRN